MSEVDTTRENCCFVCGAANRFGLRVKVEKGEGSSNILWEPRSEFAGSAGILHGGIVSALMDEAMAYAALSRARNCVTAEMSVRFLKPTMVNQAVIVRGEVIVHQNRLVHTTAELFQNEEMKATATGKFISIVSKT